MCVRGNKTKQKTTHLLLHQCPNRKAIDLQDPVANMDGISHLRTNKHPSDPGTAKYQHLCEH